jgi:tripartite-type tricarboxylate transporter receptor subunit TctC
MAVAVGRCIVYVLSLLSAWLVTGPARAESFPDRPIKLIVPYAAGGGVDIVARAVGDGLGKHFNWTVVVENRTGAGSNVGSAVVAKAEADGYTLLMGSNANAVNGSLYTNMAYDPLTELTPIVLVGRVPMVLLASPSVPIKSVRELVTYARQHPGKLNFGSGGVGTSEHLTYELFRRRADIDVVHVPYRGGAAVYPDLIGGQVQFLFNNQLQAMSFIQAGTVRVLAIANSTRSAQLPDVPTMAEQGVADFVSVAWWGIMGPRGLPPEMMDAINRAVNAVLVAPELTERLASLGAERTGGTAAQFDRFFKSEATTWAAIVRAENIKVE